MINLNINDVAKIELFELGKKIVKGYLPSLKIYNENCVDMKIAEIMEIFGSYISYSNNEKHTPFNFYFDIPSIEAKFNINHKAQVKLNEKGLLILNKYNQEIAELCKERNLEPFSVEVDDNGYIEMQMGEIMKIFGSSIISSSSNKEIQPFDFNFKIDEKDLEPITRKNR